MEITHLIRAGGWIMLPLLALSLGAVAVIIERFLTFRQLGNCSPQLLPRVVGLCETGKFDDALGECRRQSGVLAACLATVLEHRAQPIAYIERRVEEVGQAFFVQLEKGLPFLDTATTISPLLGLLGTVLGMIGAFNAIGAQRAVGNADAILGGVAEALYATATGITIAVVCFVAYNFFAARLRTITSETEMATTKLLNRLDELPATSSTRSSTKGVHNGVEKAHAI